MKSSKKIFIVISLLIAGYSVKARVLLQFPFAGSTVEILDSAGAATESSKPDEYTKALTPFDLQIRLGKDKATEKDYLATAATQARTWNKEEQELIKKSFSEIDAFLTAQKIKLNLPAKILMLKTAGKEEFEAEGYTRVNRISLCIKPWQPISTHLIAHELFHVYSRFNADKRDKIYAIFGFKKCNRINTAESMKNRVITNPDCPFTEHYIPVKVDGKPKDMVLQLYSKNDYQESYTLANYVNICLLEVAGKDPVKAPVMKNGSGVLYELEQVPDFLEQIGNNTSYVLHPEEISAEHFALWVVKQEVPQPAFMNRLEAALR